MGFLKKHFGDRYRKNSYSQCGEDLIVDFLRKRIKLKYEFNYLDIGAFHPSRFSNTFYFYKKRFSGVCVEPNPDACNLIKTKRRRDSVINAGVGSDKCLADFYVIKGGTLSTFSKEEAKKCEQNPVFNGHSQT